MTELTPTTYPVNSQADRLSELAALGELSAVLAHELRNPLSSIKGAAQILQQEWGAGKPQGEFLAIILDEVDALTALTTEFLDFARPLYPELAWSSVNDVAHSAVLSVQALARSADIEIEFEPADHLPSVLLDRYQVQRALRNLLLNAIQAMSRGGHLFVHTRHMPTGVAVEVRDSGCGVPSDDLSRIFVPFYTTKVTGMGLGLPIARKIAQNHGGDVIVTRNDGPGMTFTICLPASGESLPE